MNALRTLWKSLRSTKGYTLDQTILIIAIIAILVTLIILTVGWNLINKASGTRLAQQLGNVEDAVGNYYGDNRAWPKSNTATSPMDDALSLAGINDANSSTKNYIGGLGNATSYIYHNLSNIAQANRRVALYQVANPWGVTGGTYMIVQFQGVNYSDFLEADKAIDSSDGGNAGRVRAIAVTTAAPTATTGCFSTSALSAVSTTTVDVCYKANNVS